MKPGLSRLAPLARTDKFIVKEVDGELLVYDQQRHKAHCLNKLAADIWRLCDGSKTAAEIATQLSTPTDERAVLIGFEELRRNHLLEPFDRSLLSTNLLPKAMTRRQAVRAFGLGLAVVVPVVATITAPTPAQAGTCKHNNAGCATGGECCSGVCGSGHCVGG